MEQIVNGIFQKFIIVMSSLSKFNLNFILMFTLFVCIFWVFLARTYYFITFNKLLLVYTNV